MFPLPNITHEHFIQRIVRLRLDWYWARKSAAPG
jgi:hypothetical protein